MTTSGVGSGAGLGSGGAGVVEATLLRMRAFALGANLFLDLSGHVQWYGMRETVELLTNNGTHRELLRAQRTRLMGG
jgi:hypothetical protein